MQGSFQSHSAPVPTQRQTDCVPSVTRFPCERVTWGEKRGDDGVESRTPSGRLFGKRPSPFPRGEGMQTKGRWEVSTVHTGVK